MAYLYTPATAFERQVRKLGLNERTCVASKVLRLWCEENKDRYYIPEWLLARWGMTVTPSLAPERNDSAA
jgi:hypothetical protein